ncbi:MAG: hypothetical protein ABI068_14080 [Ktedonobacterales bacterium]
MSTLQLPPEVADTLRSFYTCEVTTVGAQGQPMTWPALTYFDEATSQFFFAVSIAFQVTAQSAHLSGEAWSALAANSLRRD